MDPAGMQYEEDLAAAVLQRRLRQEEAKREVARRRALTQVSHAAVSSGGAEEDDAEGVREANEQLHRALADSDADVEDPNAKVNDIEEEKRREVVVSEVQPTELSAPEGDQDVADGQQQKKKAKKCKRQSSSGSAAMPAMVDANRLLSHTRDLPQLQSKRAVPYGVDSSGYTDVRRSLLHRFPFYQQRLPPLVRAQDTSAKEDRRMTAGVTHPMHSEENAKKKKQKVRQVKSPTSRSITETLVRRGQSALGSANLLPVLAALQKEQSSSKGQRTDPHPSSSSTKTKAKGAVRLNISKAKLPSFKLKSTASAALGSVLVNSRYMESHQRACPDCNANATVDMGKRWQGLMQGEAKRRAAIEKSRTDELTKGLAVIYARETSRHIAELEDIKRRLRTLAEISKLLAATVEAERTLRDEVEDAHIRTLKALRRAAVRIHRERNAEERAAADDLRVRQAMREEMASQHTVWVKKMLPIWARQRRAIEVACDAAGHELLLEEDSAWQKLLMSMRNDTEAIKHKANTTWYRAWQAAAQELRDEWGLSRHRLESEASAEGDAIIAEKNADWRRIRKILQARDRETLQQRESRMRVRRQTACFEEHSAALAFATDEFYSEAPMVTLMGEVAKEASRHPLAAMFRAMAIGSVASSMDDSTEDALAVELPLFADEAQSIGFVPAPLVDRHCQFLSYQEAKGRHRIASLVPLSWAILTEIIMVEGATLPLETALGLWCQLLDGVAAAPEVTPWAARNALREDGSASPAREHSCSVILEASATLVAEQSILAATQDSLHRTRLLSLDTEDSVVALEPSASIYLAPTVTATLFKSHMKRDDSVTTPTEDALTQTGSTTVGKNQEVVSAAEATVWLSTGRHKQPLLPLDDEEVADTQSSTQNQQRTSRALSVGSGSSKSGMPSFKHIGAVSPGTESTIISDDLSYMGASDMTLGTSMTTAHAAPHAVIPQPRAISSPESRPSTIGGSDVPTTTSRPATRQLSRLGSRGAPTVVRRIELDEFQSVQPVQPPSRPTTSDAGGGL